MYSIKTIFLPSHKRKGCKGTMDCHHETHQKELRYKQEAEFRGRDL
jgi:hypothetical protein